MEVTSAGSLYKDPHQPGDGMAMGARGGAYNAIPGCSCYVLPGNEPRHVHDAFKRDGDFFSTKLNAFSWQQPPPGAPGPTPYFSKCELWMLAVGSKKWNTG